MYVSSPTWPVMRRVLPLVAALLGVVAVTGRPATAQSAGNRGVVRSDLQSARTFPDVPTIDDIIAAHRDWTEGTRIIGGTLAGPGQWPSMAAIFADVPGRGRINFCGGTVIGNEWVLTAAHCAAAMKSADPHIAFFVREDTTNLKSGGHDSRVVTIVPHDEYDAKLVLNDIAILKVASPLKAPHQKLIGSALASEALKPQRMSTVIGFGRIAEGGSASSSLRQVDLPLVAQNDCSSAHEGEAITDANFCAGERAGGKDSCQGDSGGPLFVPDQDGEQLQTGVVSWGKGCARPGLYGVYASVGHFQEWIRARVPDAVFVDRKPPAPSGINQTASAADTAAAALVSNAADTAKPSTIAQVTVDFAEGDALKVGQFVEVRVTSSVSGAVVVYNENPDGRAYQLYPSKAFPAPGADPAVARIEAGKTLHIPSSIQRDQGYRFVIRPPTGVNKLRAVVVPDSKAMQDIVRANFEGGDIRDLSLVMNHIVDAELGNRGPEPVKIEPVDRGSAERTYEILAK